MLSGPSDPIPHIARSESAQDAPLQIGSKSFSLLFGTLGAVVVIAGLLLVFGVRFTSDYMTYDVSKEMTIQGSVVGFEEFACPAADGELERHLLLKTADRNYEIHLAASRIMRSVGWQFKQGDTIEVVGAQVSYRGKDGLIARQITEANNIYTFRNPAGTLLIKQ